jgi:hypothetical protein
MRLPRTAREEDLCERDQSLSGYMLMASGPDIVNIRVLDTDMMLQKLLLQNLNISSGCSAVLGRRISDSAWPVNLLRVTSSLTQRGVTGLRPLHQTTSPHHTGQLP